VQNGFKVGPNYCRPAAPVRPAALHWPYWRCCSYFRQSASAST
jgi:hypothetical protein